MDRLARESEPVVRQLLVAQGPTGDERAFRRKLTVIRRRVELATAARRVPEATFHIASFSSSTLTYKGLPRRGGCRPTTPTCAEPDVYACFGFITYCWDAFICNAILA